MWAIVVRDAGAGEIVRSPPGWEQSGSGAWSWDESGARGADHGLGAEPGGEGILSLSPPAGMVAGRLVRLRAAYSAPGVATWSVRAHGEVLASAEVTVAPSDLSVDGCAPNWLEHDLGPATLGEGRFEVVFRSSAGVAVGAVGGAPPDGANLWYRTPGDEYVLVEAVPLLVVALEDVEVPPETTDGLRSLAPAPAVDDAACAARAWCSELGLCTADGARCAAVSDADCDRPGGACEVGGRCVARAGVCVAETSGHCRRSVVCHEDGRCSPRDGVCAAISDKDCVRSDACRQGGACVAIDGRHG